MHDYIYIYIYIIYIYIIASSYKIKELWPVVIDLKHFIENHTFIIETNTTKKAPLSLKCHDTTQRSKVDSVRCKG